MFHLHVLMLMHQTDVFLQEQFWIFKYSSIVHALLYSQSHVLGFYIKSSLQELESPNSLHSHQPSSWFNFCFEFSFSFIHSNFILLWSYMLMIHRPFVQALNNPINIFFVNPNITLYCVFHWMFMNIQKIININIIIINWKNIEKYR